MHGRDPNQPTRTTHGDPQHQHRPPVHSAAWRPGEPALAGAWHPAHRPRQATGKLRSQPRSGLTRHMWPT